MPVRLDRSTIEVLLPHRGPAMFITEAEVDGGTVRGGCAWDTSHPHLSGHFPENPIVPGVFLVEAAAQLAGVLIATSNPGLPGLGMLAGVRRTLIHQPVRPGDKINFILQINSMPGNLFDVRGFGRFADGRKAVTLDLTIAVRPPLAS